MRGAFKPGLIDVVLVFFFLALFDSIGTLIGVAGRIGARAATAQLPRARQALLADAIGTVVGRRPRDVDRHRVHREFRPASRPAAEPDSRASSTASLFLLALFFSPARAG